MPFLQLDQVKLFYTDDGEGDLPLLLVHGYTCDSHDWSWQIEHFVSHHRVIAVDLRGHGASSAPADGYTTVQFIEDLVGLLDHLELGRVVAMGHSMGGIIVSALAVEYPDRVAAVVAVDAAYLMDDAVAGALGPMVESLDDDSTVPFVQGIIGGMASPARDPGRRTWQIRRIASMEPHVLRQSLLAQVSGMVVRSESEPYLRRRQCPVLSFHADPARGAVEAALFTDDSSHVVGWEGSGHWLHQERPAELNALVSTWLTSLKCRSSLSRPAKPTNLTPIRIAQVSW